MARALRNGEDEKAVFLIARMEKGVPVALKPLIAAAAREALLCETHDAAPESAGPFNTFYQRRLDAKAKLVEAMQRIVLRQRPTSEEEDQGESEA
jgi:hypothetical protein